MNKALRNTLLVVLIIVFISTVSYCSAPFDTETAHMVNIRKTVLGSGYILKQESVVELSPGSIFEPGISSGQRISKGGSVGVSISGNLNDNLVKELEELTLRIEEIEQSNSIADIYASDEARIYTALKDISASIREDVRRGDFPSAQNNTAQLSSLLEKKYSVENQNAATNLLISLKERKYEIEKQLGGFREDVKAPSAGYYYETLDGLESGADEKTIGGLTVTKIEEFATRLQEFTPDDSHAGKIVNTYRWYLAAVMDKEKVSDLSAGQAVTVSVDNSSPVKATILSINESENNTVALIIKCTRDILGIWDKRTAEFELCYEEYSGLYVPAAAIRVVDDVTGVYVLNQNESVSFKCVDILLKEEDYYVVRQSYSPPESVEYSALKQYDNILVNPEAVQ